VTLPLARFRALPRRERRCLIEAALCLLAVRLVLAVLPFRDALRLIGAVPGEASAGRQVAAEPGEIRRAIERAARHVPFRAVCLQQGFAALLMLRRRGLAATVHFGLAQGAEGRPLVAHAWSCCGPIAVTGGDTAAKFVAVANFAA